VSSEYCICRLMVSGPPLSFFSNSDQLLTDVGPVELWTALASSKRSGKSTGLLAPYTVGSQRTRFSDRDCGTTVTVSCRCCDPWLEPILSTAALMPAEPHIRSPFPRTAGTTIPHSQGHWAREGGSTLYVGISQPLFVTVRLPGSNGADQALVELTTNDSDRAKCLNLLS
jgi:hypothetical protein